VGLSVLFFFVWPCHDCEPLSKKIFLIFRLGKM
jgi:hypothetical protein